MDLVIYHGNCMDGFGAAWAAWLKHGDSATYIPAGYGDEPPDVRGKSVAIVDFSYPRDVLIRMHEEASSLIVLDHHKTAEEALRGLDFCEFDMNRSGAGMAWDFFHGGYRPWVVDYIEDRDLWRFRLPDSKTVNAYLSTLEHSFQAFSTANAMSDSEAARLGSGVLAYIEQYVREMGRQARMVLCPVGSRVYRVPCVNAPYINTSELVGALAEDHPFAVGWHQRGSGQYAFSLRSRGAEGMDVSVVARQWGGGGHRNAAGFVVDHRPAWTE